MALFTVTRPQAEGDEHGPDSQGRVWIEDAYGGFIRIGKSNSTGGAVYFGPEPPADTEFEAGAVFIQDTTFQSYVFDGDAWVETTGRGSGGADTAKVQDLEDRLVFLEKALMPYVEFLEGPDERWMRYEPGGNHTSPKMRLTQYWSSSSAGTTRWAWMVTWPGESESVDIDDLPKDRLDAIGYEPNSVYEQWNYLYFYPPNEADMPDIKVELLVQDSMDGFGTAMEYSKPFYPRDTWINKDDIGSATTKKPQKQSRGSLRGSLLGLLKNSKKEADK